MNEIVIRESNVKDAAQIASLMEQLGYPICEEAMKKNIQLYSEFPLHKSWVATHEDQIIGCISIAIIHYFHEPISILRVISMIINQNHRRKGIGKKLMETAECYASLMNCSRVELSSGIQRASMGSHDFYRSLGYVELDFNRSHIHFGKQIYRE